MSSTATNTTVPVCSSCAITDKCCIFTTSKCLPVRLHEEKTTEELIDTDAFAQILFVMCNHGFLWNPCSGPHNDGFTISGLLTELQQVFPDSNWDEADLEVLLLSGIARGLFKKRTVTENDETSETFFANQNLLNVNPRNWIYEDVCPQLCAKKQCVKPSTLGC